MMQARQKYALSDISHIMQRFQGKKPIIFLDYDGTLTPIVSRPELAQLSEGMRVCLKTLSQHYPVAIISGRQLKDVRQLVGLDQLYYVGNHGLEITGPQYHQKEKITTNDDFQEEINALYKKLEKSIGNIPGILIEHKKFSLTVHYRCVKESNVSIIEQAVDNALLEYKNLLKRLGKKVFEVRPAVGWDKGKVILYLLDELNVSKEDILPIYIGDDLTDEDAFLALKNIGMSVLVSESERESYADYYVKNVEEVKKILNLLIERGCLHG